MKSPAFQFYAADWLASQRVTLMTLEEEGAYMRALCFCWLHGSIPADPAKLARLIGKGASTTLASTVTTMFEAEGGVLVHPRLEEERNKQATWRAKSSAGGKKSAEQRKKANSFKGASTTLEAPSEVSLPNGGNQNPTLLSSSSLVPPIAPQGARRPRSKKKSEASPEALAIYAAYPRKVAKPKALAAIEKALLSKPADYLLGRVKSFAVQMAGKDPDFITYPAKWFNDERYDDEPHPAPANAENPSGFVPVSRHLSSTQTLLPQLCGR